jgi:hypothetical protein
MTQTTLIGGLGLSVFALSTFTPTQRFGLMMLALLAAALVGDLVLLPALLASPLGKAFCPKVQPGQRPHEPSDTGEQADEETPALLPLSQEDGGSPGSPHTPREEDSGGGRSPGRLRPDRRHGGINAP